MLNMRINKQPLWYALYNGQEELLDRDDDGNIIYDEIDGEDIPRASGHWALKYQVPVQFFGNINSGNVGEAIARPYGISLASSEAILCMRKGELPIDEQTLIWYQHPPDITYLPLDTPEDDERLIFSEDNVVVKQKSEYAIFNPKTADYRVRRVPPCLNEIIYLLQRQDNNGESEDN